MRIVYLDEAGVSNPKHEPYLVVAGVLVDGDKDWPKLQEELESIARRYDLRSIYHFHAKDIFHGNGVFSKNDPNWPLVRRRKLLFELASIPNKFSLPVVAGFVCRKSFAIAVDAEQDAIYQRHPRLKRSKPNYQMAAYGEAFVDAVRSADYWLEAKTPNEQGLVIVENSPEMRRDLKLIQAVYRDKDLRFKIAFTKVRPFKSARIIETVHFAGKRESPLLQLADICAFTFKRRLMRRPDVEEFYSVLEPQLVRTKSTANDRALEFQAHMDAYEEFLEKQAG